MQTGTSTIAWEIELAELLADLSDVQQEMLDILAAKRDAMAHNDVERMSDLQPREQQLCDRLQICHDRRGQLLEQAAENGLPSDSLGNLASSLKTEKRNGLRKQVKDTSGRMRLLQHHSLANWVLAQRTMLHLSQLLEIIATGGRLQPTYGRGASPESSGALVDREA